MRDSAAVRVCPWEAKVLALMPFSSTVRSSLWGPERHIREARSAPWWDSMWARSCSVKTSTSAAGSVTEETV